jgi:hypothetical protein
VASYRHIRNTHRIVVSREKPADWLLSQVLADLYGLDLPATDLSVAGRDANIHAVLVEDVNG